MGEHQRLAGAQSLDHPVLVDGPGVLIRHQHHDHIRGCGSIRHGPDVEPRRPGAVPGFSAGPQAHDDSSPALAEVQRMRVPLAAVADDGKGAPVETARFSVGIVVHPNWCGHRHVPD
jgi:hypothetical protein